MLERAGRVVALIEIQSGSKVDDEDLRHIKALGPDFDGAKCFCLYGGETRYLDQGVLVLPWLEGVGEVVASVTQPVRI